MSVITELTGARRFRVADLGIPRKQYLILQVQFTRKVVSPDGSWNVDEIDWRDAKPEDITRYEAELVK